MQNRILQVFYGNDRLPYKDKDRTVHYPITGNTFLGSSNVDKIRFYVRDIGGTNNITWVLNAKLPNGSIFYQVLSTIGLDSELNEYYVEFSVSQFYTQLKGDTYIALNGCDGNVSIETDSETNIQTITATIESQTILTTGVIKFSNNYAPQRPVGFSFDLDQYQAIINALSNKSNIANTIQVVANITSEDLTGYATGQLFYSLAQHLYYKKVATSPYYELADKGILGESKVLYRIGEIENETFQDIYDIVGLQRLFVLKCNDIEYLCVYGLEEYSEVPQVTALDLNSLHAYRMVSWYYDDYFADLFEGDYYEVKFVIQTNNSYKIYGTNGSGNQAYIDYDVSADPNNIVQRDSSGQINVPTTPTQNAHATSKKYVDDSIATLGSALKYRGSLIASQINVLTGMALGDMYNVTDSGTLTQGNVSVVAGDNVAWNGSAWDKLAGDIDLSGFVKKTQKIAGIDLIDDITKEELSGALEIPSIRDTVVQVSLNCDIFGLADNDGYLQDDNSVNTNSAYSYSDYIEIPNNAKSIIIGTRFKVGTLFYTMSPCLLFFADDKSLISYISASNSDFTVAAIPNNAKYFRFNKIKEQGSVSEVTKGCFISSNLSQRNIINQLTYNGDLSPICATEPYLLNTDGTINVNNNYVHSNFIRIPDGAKQVKVGQSLVVSSVKYYVNPAVLFYDNSGNLISTGGGVQKDYANYDIPDGAVYVRFNQVKKGGSIAVHTDGFWFSPSYNERIEGETYYVGGNSGNTSFTEMLLNLKDNENKKTIIVYGGDYDIFEEYKALQAANKIPTIPETGVDPIYDFTTYSVFVPKNTHIIGKGIVRLLYQPDANVTYEAESKALSPLNVAGSCIIENIEIHCKNARYCIHDEVLQDGQYIGTRHIYKNVKCVKYPNDNSSLGTPQTFGCGIGREMYFEFDNCYFENKINDMAARCLYFHNRTTVDSVTLTEKMSSNIVVKNSIMLSASNNLAVFLGNIGATLPKIRVDIDSCYVGGNIVSADEGNWQTGNRKNTFAITVLLTKYNNISVADPNNSYIPVIYN